jgi:hypothetical protein
MSEELRYRSSGTEANATTASTASSSPLDTIVRDGARQSRSV